MTKKKITKKEFQGYLKALADQRKNVLGGVGYNDNYNLATFGIDNATHTRICRIISDKYGSFPPEHLKLSDLNKE